MRIIPGILARSGKEFDKQIKSVFWADKVHIDIMDGLFIKEKTKAKKIPRNAQLHLMVKNPVKWVKKYPENEVIIHSESKESFKALELAKKQGQKAGIALNPETKISKKFLKLADFVLVMSVHPGKSGSKMLKAPLKKIKEIKKSRRIPVGVDGGINLKTVRGAAKAGADFAIATSAVTLSAHPKESWKLLKKF